MVEATGLLHPHICSHQGIAPSAEQKGEDDGVYPEALSKGPLQVVPVHIAFTSSLVRAKFVQY